MDMLYAKPMSSELAIVQACSHSSICVIFVAYEYTYHPWLPLNPRWTHPDDDFPLPTPKDLISMLFGYLWVTVERRVVVSLAGQEKSSRFYNIKNND